MRCVQATSVNRSFLLRVLTHDVPPVLQDKDLEVCAVNLKLDQLEAELQDLNSQESKDEASLAKVPDRFIFTDVLEHTTRAGDVCY